MRKLADTRRKLRPGETGLSPIFRCAQKLQVNPSKDVKTERKISGTRDRNLV